MNEVRLQQEVINDDRVPTYGLITFNRHAVSAHITAHPGVSHIRVRLANSRDLVPADVPNLGKEMATTGRWRRAPRAVAEEVSREKRANSRAGFPLCAYWACLTA